MNISDIIALAKQGYKPSDIKELIALTQPTTEEEAPKEEPKAVESAEEEPKAEVEKTAEPSDKDILIKQLQNQIRELQQANTRISRQEAPKEDTKSILEEMARGFM